MKTTEAPVYLYMHAGSGNHGCEAIAVSICRLLHRRFLSSGGDEARYMPPVIVSNSAAQDRAYRLGALERDGLCRLLEERRIAAHPVAHTAYYIWRRLSGDRESFQRYRFAPMRRSLRKEAADDPGKRPVIVSIGGDNYCYPEMLPDLMLANRMFASAGYPTALFGCSIEPDLMKRPALTEDLRSYRRIVARESITCRALREAGIDAGRLSLAPDPAFALEEGETSFPEGFRKHHTVGINISPMVQDNESIKGVTMAGYRHLLRHILSRTDEQIALIPHVVWKNSDDRVPLRALYDEFRESRRVVLVEDRDAEALKRIIGSCTAFVGARTHATIAAYSRLVPTLVVGYSVKARGIARDIFGTEASYVLPVQELREPAALPAAFDRLWEKRSEIRAHLTRVMPAYIARAEEGIAAIQELQDGGTD